MSFRPKHNNPQELPASLADQSEAGIRALSERLRPMNKADIEKATTLVRRAMNAEEGHQAGVTFRYHFSTKEHGLDDGREYTVLSGKQDEVYGIVGLHQYEWGPPENVWLAWFAVDPTLHHRGLGTYLIDFITQLATQRGYMKFYIETYSTPEFEKARAFYEAKGFRQVGHVKSYLPNGGDMLVFVKELTPNA